MIDLMDMSEKEALQAENAHLRAALATSKDPCIYCQLPAEEMAKCRAGFPGCARADDMTGCPEFGSAMEAHDLRSEVDRLLGMVPRWRDAITDPPPDWLYGREVVRIEGRDYWLHVPIPPLPGTETP